MKYGIASLAVVSMFALTSCNNASSKIKDNPAESSVSYGQVEEGDAITAGDVVAQGTPAFTFEEKDHDFGDITEGDVVETVFTFTNTGDAPLIISHAQGSCGCTVPEWPRTPIQPGESNQIKVSFNSANKGGVTKKNVTLTANTVPTSTVLTIKANVQPK